MSIVKAFLVDFNEWLGISNRKETWLQPQKVSIETIEKIIKLIEVDKFQ